MSRNRVLPISTDTPRLPSRSTVPAPHPNAPLARRRSPRLLFSDRHIPNRVGVDLQAAFSLTQQEFLPAPGRTNHADVDVLALREDTANQTFLLVLRAELFGDNVPQTVGDLHTDTKPLSAPARPHSTGTILLSPGHYSPRTSADQSTPRSAIGEKTLPSTPRRKNNLFTYKSPSKLASMGARALHNELFSLSPVRQELQRFLLSPQRKPRSISKVPYRVLDAPELSDDFYLNLVDWGLQDVLAVGLGDSVYMWDGATQLVDRLCNLTNQDKVTSISWIGLGTHLAVGTSNGLVEIWDATRQKCVRTMTGHSLRVSSLAWNEHILLSGLRDRLVLNRDVRVEQHFINKFLGHLQEVCGLKWNPDVNKLASGGNDNRLIVWDGLNTRPLHVFNDHVAAVKAIAWLPHQRGVLALGGGTADRTIKTWNTLTGNMVHNIDTGSQVCNLVWSRTTSELVSTHGYSRNQIIVWKYPLMQQIAQLTGHTYRVLYLSLSPDGETLVTGAGDETLRFWNVFEKSKDAGHSSSILLDAFQQLR